MRPDEIQEYKALVEDAKNAANEPPPGKSPFPVFFGFECEWSPKYETWYRDFLLGEVGAQYLVYGSHWIPDNDDFLYLLDNAESHLLRRYTDITVQGIRSGLYAFIAHPDIFLGGYVHLNADVKAACRDIIDAAVAMDIPMEINGLGLQREKIRGDTGFRSPYPVREFWEMAAAMGARIICNSDAHRPIDVVQAAQNAYRFAEEIGITPIDPATALGFA